MKKIYLFLLLLFASITGYASHLVGGDLRVVFRSQSAAGPVYRIVFNLYYDDRTGSVPLGLEDFVRIYSKRTNTPIGTPIKVFKRSRISAVYPGISSGCPINTVVNTGIYLYDVELVLDPSIYNDVLGYYATAGTCCRNDPGVPTNIAGPGSVGFAFYTEFPRVTNVAVAPFTVANSLINSTPDFGQLSGEYLCVGQEFTATYAATDADNDQLEYDIVEPLDDFTSTGSNSPLDSPVPWNAGFSLANLFAASPANQVRINSSTGVLTVKPNAAGMYSFAVRCTERRNGVKIGEIRREFQYLVRATCDPALLPVPSVPNLPTTSTGDYILDLNNGPSIDFIIKGSKGKAISKLDIIPQSANFTLQDLNINTIFSPNPTSPGGVPLNTVTGEGKVKLTWPPCLYSKNATDIYEFDFVITDNSCPNANVSTTKIRLKVLQRNNPAPKWEITSTRNIAIIDQYGSINATSTPITVGDSVKFTIMGRDAGDSLRIRARASSDGEYFTFVPKNISYTFPSTTKDVALAEFVWAPQCSLVRNNARREEIVLDIFIEERASCEKLRTTVKVKLILEDNGVTADYQPINVFTPNEDGKNDDYTLPMLRNAKCLYTFKKITIHNRLGKEVFQSDKEDFSWKAKDYATGLYYYRIEYENYEYKGSLQVLR